MGYSDRFLGTPVCNDRPAVAPFPINRLGSIRAAVFEAVAFGTKLPKECLRKLEKRHLTFSNYRDTEHLLKAPLSHQFLCAVLSVTALSSVAPPQNKSADEIALIDQISSYYAAYSKKDLGALLMFWSQRSPDLPAGIEEAQHTLVGGVYAVSEVSISQIKIADNKAILQASALFASSDEQARVMRNERRVRNFALIKEGGQWKIWRGADNAQDLSAFLEKGSEWQVSADSLEQFAVALVNASEAEREHLLADNQKMITTDLRNALTIPTLLLGLLTNRGRRSRLGSHGLESTPRRPCEGLC